MRNPILVLLALGLLFGLAACGPKKPKTAPPPPPSVPADRVEEPAGVQPEPKRPAAPEPGVEVDKPPRRYYAAEHGLPMYAEPRFSERVLFRLPLNTEVLRYKTKRGFAFVSPEGLDLKGWVDNAKLDWRKVEPDEAARPAPAPDPAPEVPKAPPAKKAPTIYQSF